MNYIEVSLSPVPFSEEVTDVLSAMLASIDYDSFSMETSCLKAYCPSNKYSENALLEILDTLPFTDVRVLWDVKEIETQDWNAEWEETVMFEPIVIGEKCCIHSPKTADIPTCKYDVVLAPKMSFGSGHHETTSQLLEEIIAYFEDRQKVAASCSVLDMGCGTAVLAILAARCGATYVRAIEIDDWVADNARDNVLLNGLAGQVVVECGDATLLANGIHYDLVLANINRNVLLEDMHSYVSNLNSGGILMMSGFYEEDLQMIRECAEGLGMTFLSHKSRNRWTMAVFEKKSTN
ncbi:MAG: 50S ribosomal protein L11 methyltransferase [Bacteroidales bacterium]|nr:50S ribosomal protein L11 methyltransferase [Bacteroidales bacterium]